MHEKKLFDELRRCVSAWGDDFRVDIQQEDIIDGTAFFYVVLSHFHLGEDYHFRARVADDGCCEMCYSGDDWQSIDTGNLFAWLWFETAAPKA